MAKTPVITDRSTDAASFTFDDMMQVDAVAPYLKCSCPQARRTTEPTKQLCKHIKMVIEERQDNLLVNLGSIANWLISLPILLTGPGLWITVRLEPVDETGARAVSWNKEVMCYLRASSISRLQLRDLIWFNVLNFALNQRCEQCSIPESFTYITDSTNQMRAIRDGLWIQNTHRCTACDVSSLLPGVDK